MLYVFYIISYIIYFFNTYLRFSFKFWFASGSLPPIGYEVDSSLAYAGRRNTCYISHTDGDNAPAS